MGTDSATYSGFLTETVSFKAQNYKPSHWHLWGLLGKGGGWASVLVSPRAEHGAWPPRNSAGLDGGRVGRKVGMIWPRWGLGVVQEAPRQEADGDAGLGTPQIHVMEGTEALPTAHFSPPVRALTLACPCLGMQDPVLLPWGSGQGRTQGPTLPGPRPTSHHGDSGSPRSSSITSPVWKVSTGFPGGGGLPW